VTRAKAREADACAASKKAYQRVRGAQEKSFIIAALFRLPGSNMLDGGDAGDCFERARNLRRDRILARQFHFHLAAASRQDK